MAKTNSNPQAKELLKSLKKFIRTKGTGYLKDKNISSIGIGYKIKDNKVTDEICIQFTVAEKVEADILESMEDTNLIPSTIIVDGVEIKTDVIQRSYELSYTTVEDLSESARKQKMNPVQPGISVGNFRRGAGTLGCIVYDKDTKQAYALSNWHVFHGNQGLLGDTVVQPGILDDNRAETNICGKLVRSYLGIAGDCAIASIDSRSFNEAILGLNTHVKKLAEVELGDVVVKSGRTTEVTFGKVTRIDIVINVPYGLPAGNVDIGCFEIGIHDAIPPSTGEISSKGDSGAAWMIVKAGNKASDVLAGLHFAGETGSDSYEYALACYPKSVFKKLGIVPSINISPNTTKSKGYQANFLGTTIPVPTLDQENVALKVGSSIVVDYTHFSLTMHKSRRMAIWVAWNINGGNLKKLNRNNIPFKLDSRIPAKNQIGEHLYSNNDIDRGHIARRADLIWGEIDEAKKANTDSFFFTNIVPQMNHFNQSGLGGIWGKLEDAVFEEVDVDNLKISLIGGPIFNDDDKTYRNIKVPREFFKIIYYKVAGKTKQKAFLLTQNLSQLETLDLHEFKIYEVPLSTLESRCDFKLTQFATEIEDADTDEMTAKQLKQLHDIQW